MSFSNFQGRLLPFRQPGLSCVPAAWGARGTLTAPRGPCPGCRGEGPAGSYLPQDPQFGCFPSATTHFSSSSNSSPFLLLLCRAKCSFCQESRGCNTFNFYTGYMNHGANKVQVAETESVLTHSGFGPRLSRVPASPHPTETPQLVQGSVSPFLQRDLQPI